MIDQWHLNRPKKDIQDKYNNVTNTTSTPMQSSQDGYLNKFMTCFRRNLVNKVHRTEP
jgi:hypothetical protein